mmetsp:Transcript_9745/g.36624  ORF Transcript_9745/g.36624 Transcript_9745/m.36624 type:complete len:359 (+) Transcript_9745:2307-3383(+)
MAPKPLTFHGIFVRKGVRTRPADFAALVVDGHEGSVCFFGPCVATVFGGAVGEVVARKAYAQPKSLRACLRHAVLLLLFVLRFAATRGHFGLRLPFPRRIRFHLRLARFRYRRRHVAYRVSSLLIARFRPVQLSVLAAHSPPEPSLARSFLPPRERVQVSQVEADGSLLLRKRFCRASTIRHRHLFLLRARRVLRHDVLDVLRRAAPPPFQGAQIRRPCGDVLLGGLARDAAQRAALVLQEVVEAADGTRPDGRRGRGADGRQRLRLRLFDQRHLAQQRRLQVRLVHVIEAVLPASSSAHRGAADPLEQAGGAAEAKQRDHEGEEHEHGEAAPGGLAALRRGPRISTTGLRVRLLAGT